MVKFSSVWYLLSNIFGIGVMFFVLYFLLLFCLRVIEANLVWFGTLIYLLGAVFIIALAMQCVKNLWEEAWYDAKQVFKKKPKETETLGIELVGDEN